MKASFETFLPLAPATLHILLAVAEEPRHGYGIMQEVARQSQGQCALGPGTLYDNIQRLLAAELIREVSLGAGKPNARRRYYALTDLGRRVLEAEASRLEEVVRVAKARLRQPLPGTA